MVEALGVAVKYVLRVFGFPVLSFGDEDAGFEDEVEVQGRHIEGGSAHNFERDVNPVTPEDRYNWEWEDRNGFGFRR